MDEKRQLLHHFLAALAYRTQKALRGAPATFENYRAGPGVRTPHEVLRHMSSVLGYARTFFIGGAWRPERLSSLQEEEKRFHGILEELASHLTRQSPFREATAERMLQGPFSDAMTHAGQLAMLRRLSGSPIRPENFILADINPSNLGSQQPDPVSPDKEWLAAEDEQ